MPLTDTKILSQSRNRIRARIVQQFRDQELGPDSRLFYGPKQQSTKKPRGTKNYLAITPQVISPKILITQWDSLLGTNLFRPIFPPENGLVSVAVLLSLFVHHLGSMT